MAIQTTSLHDPELKQLCTKLLEAFNIGKVRWEGQALRVLPTLINSSNSQNWPADQCTAYISLIESAVQAFTTSPQLLEELCPVLEAAANTLMLQTGVISEPLTPILPKGTIVQAYLPIPPTISVDQLKVQAAKAKLRLLTLKK